MSDGLLPLTPRGPVPPVPLDPGAVLLPGFGLPGDDALLAAIAAVATAAPPRRMVVPGGGVMSAELTSCGALGWTSDATGYRYLPHDPDDGRPWPAMPDVLRDLAVRAAAAGGYDGFAPDSCLVNRYAPGARMGLHRDAEERDFAQPIVSVSLGLPIAFLWGGLRRADPTRVVPLEHGDVVVWGGPARRVYHGVRALRDGHHPKTGACRYNLTFRRAG